MKINLHNAEFEVEKKLVNYFLFKIDVFRRRERKPAAADINRY